MKIIFNCAGWINFRKLINILYLLASLFHQLMFYYQYLHSTIWISGINHYVSNIIQNPFSMLIETYFDKKVHGTFSRVPWNFLNNIWTTPVVPWNSMKFEQQNLKFRGIPWNFVQIQSSMEFYGTFSILLSSMECHGTFNFPQKSSMELFRSSMEFHGIPWNLINFIFKKSYF